MALIVEDGTGKRDAESYGSVADADIYHAKYGNAKWATYSPGDKEIALRKATDHMVMTLRGLWQGWRTVTGQALDWPRCGTYRDEHERDLVPDNEVPPEVKGTCFDLALIVAGGTPLVPTSSARGKKSIKVGPVAVVYDGDAPQAPVFVAAMRRIGCYLLPSAGGFTVDLVRR